MISPVGATPTEINNMKPILSPPGWGADSLTEFMERAYHGRFATFVNKKDWFRRLAGLDDCFVRVAKKDWLNPRDMLTPLFFLRSHAAYRAACEHAMAGQVTEAFPQIRVCIEYAGYALHIDKTPGLDEIWLRRHDDETARNTAKGAFQIGKIRPTIEKANRHAAKVFDELYERAIDFGAHPNERSITGNLRITDLDDRTSYEQIYLHDDGPPLIHALKSTAQAGVCALEIFQEIFGPRFELLGVRAEVLELRKGL
jgi:hypothetical protein